MQKDTGFTLLELIITVAVLAILVTLGIPSFQETIRNNRLTTSTNELIVALNLARSEAIKRGKTVTVCKSANQSNCTPTSGNWEDGWIVFVDDDKDGVQDPGEDDNGNGVLDVGEDDDGDGVLDSDIVLQVKGTLQGNITLRTGTHFEKNIQYKSIGLSTNNDTFTFCAGANHARQVIVSPTGRPRTEINPDPDDVSCP